MLIVFGSLLDKVGGREIDMSVPGAVGTERGSVLVSRKLLQKY